MSQVPPPRRKEDCVEERVGGRREDYCTNILEYVNQGGPIPPEKKEGRQVTESRIEEKSRRDVVREVRTGT